MQTDSHVLPDVLPTGLCAAICGTAAGNTSATLAAYYAKPFRGQTEAFSGVSWTDGTGTFTKAYSQSFAELKPQTANGGMVE
jgi:hypothetical protein